MGRAAHNPEYVYVPHNESKPYFDMGHEGVVADNMFQSQLDESFVAHQYVIAAQANWSVDLAQRAHGAATAAGTTRSQIISKERTIGGGQPPCFDYQTLGDELDASHLSWRFYASSYGSASSGDGGDVVELSSDAAHLQRARLEERRDLAELELHHRRSRRQTRELHLDHAGLRRFRSRQLPGRFRTSWVAALVNTVGKSKFWDSTAIFIQWDDWGGLYDHVPPPYQDRDSVGFRVPLVILSPYSKQNYVSHVQYETASVLRFAENLWGLDQLAPADRRATSPGGDCFDFTRTPHEFRKDQRAVAAEILHAQPPDDYMAPDYE